MSFHLTRNNSGVVLITVLMVIIVMSIMATSILSQYLSQASTTDSQVKEVKAKEIAQGAFWRAQTEMNAGTANPTTGYVVRLDGTDYTVTVTPQPGPNTLYDAVRVTYN